MTTQPPGPPQGPPGAPPGGGPPPPPAPPPTLGGQDEVQRYSTASTPQELKQMLDASGMTDTQKQAMWSRVAMLKNQGHPVGGPPMGGAGIPGPGAAIQSGQLKPGGGAPPNPMAGLPPMPGAGAAAGAPPQAGPGALPPHVMPPQAAMAALQPGPDGNVQMDGSPQKVKALLSLKALAGAFGGDAQSSHMANVALQRIAFNEAQGKPWADTAADLNRLQEMQINPWGARYGAQAAAQAAYPKSGEAWLLKHIEDLQGQLKDSKDRGDPPEVQQRIQSLLDVAQKETRSSQIEQKGDVQKALQDPRLQQRADLAHDQILAHLKIAADNRAASMNRFLTGQANAFTRQDRSFIDRAGQPTTTEKATLDNLEIAAPAMARVKALLEPYKSENSLESELGQRWKNFAYSEGFAGEMTPIIQQINFLDQPAVRAYMQGRPNQKMYSDLMSHVLNPKVDTPAMLYEKLTGLEQIMNDVPDAINHSIDRRVQTEVARVRGQGGQGAQQTSGGNAAPENTVITVNGQKQIKKGGIWVPYGG